MELKNQLIITSRADSIRVIFEKPLRIPNKIALKSLYYPRFSTVEIFYLYLCDSANNFYILPITTGLGFKDSGELAWIIYETIWDFCVHEDRNTPDILEWYENQLHPSYDSLKEKNIPPQDYIFLRGTGLKILDFNDGKLDLFSTPKNYKNIFNLFQEGSVRITQSNGHGFTIRYHKFEQKDDDVMVFVYCNAVQGTYVNSKILQVLDLVHLKKENDINFLNNEQPFFKDTVFSEILTLEIYFKTLDGKNISFDFSEQSLILKIIFE